MTAPEMICPCCAVATVLDSLSRCGARLVVSADRLHVEAGHHPVPESTVRLVAEVELELRAVIEAEELLA